MRNSQQTEEHVGDDKTITQDLAITAKKTSVWIETSI